MRTIQLLQAKLHEREAIVLARQEKASSADREVSSATAAASQMNSRLHKAEAELHALRSSHQATQDRLLRSEACVKMLGAELRAYRRPDMRGVEEYSNLESSSSGLTLQDAGQSDSMAELHAASSAQDQFTDATGRGTVSVAGSELQSRLESAEQEAAGFLNVLISRKDELDSLRKQTASEIEERKRVHFDLEVMKRALTTAQERVVVLEAETKTQQRLNMEQQEREAERVADLNAAVTREQDTVIQLKVKLQQTEQKVSFASRALESLHGRLQQAEAAQAASREHQQAESEQVKQENNRIKEELAVLEEKCNKKQVVSETVVVEVVKEVPVQVIKEVIKERIVEVPVERIVEVVREVPVERRVVVEEAVAKEVPVAPVEVGQNAPGAGQVVSQVAEGRAAALEDAAQRVRKLEGELERARLQQAATVAMPLGRVDKADSCHAGTASATAGATVTPVASRFGESLSSKVEDGEGAQLQQQRAPVVGQDDNDALIHRLQEYERRLSRVSERDVSVRAAASARVQALRALYLFLFVTGVCRGLAASSASAY